MKAGWPPRSSSPRTRSSRGWRWPAPAVRRPRCEIWEHALKDGADHAEMLDHFTRLSVRLQRMDQALDAARRLSKQPGWEARGLFLLAEIDEFIDDPPGVVAALEPALEREPEARGALFDAAHYRKLLARNLLRLGRPAEAETQLKAIRPRTAGRRRRPRTARPSGCSAGPTSSRTAWPRPSRALDRSGSYGAEHRLMPEPGPYIGSAACVPCHPRTRAASTTPPGIRDRSITGRDSLGLPVPDRPVPDPDDPGVMHTIERKGGEIEARSQIDDRVTRMVVEYAFGTPQHYLTMIARDEDKDLSRPCASRIITRRPDRAGGRRPATSAIRTRRRTGAASGSTCATASSAAFIATSRAPATSATRRPAGGPGPEAADRGIGCERCHGPGGNHIKAIDERSRGRQGLRRLRDHQRGRHDGRDGQRPVRRVPHRRAALGDLPEPPRTPATSARRA